MRPNIRISKGGGSVGTTIPKASPIGLLLCLTYASDQTSQSAVSEAIKITSVKISSYQPSIRSEKTITSVKIL